MGQKLFGLDNLSSETMSSIVSMPYARGSFFVKPTFFNVDHAINPHMLDESGKPNQINFDVAQKQWKALVSTYESLGLEIQIFEPLKECPDMVFCANQSLPCLLYTSPSPRDLSTSRMPSSA